MAQPNVTKRIERPNRKIYFTWMIENTCKFSRRLHSATFTTDGDCKHKFQIVAKFSEMFPDVHISNVSIGLQRADSLNEPINVANRVKLLNMNGDQYSYKESRWVTWKKDEAPIYVLSELFSDLPDKLLIPEVKTNISFKDDNEMVGIKGKKLLASYRNLKKVFVLPKDVLIVTGKMKIFGCCPVERVVENHQNNKRLKLQINEVVNDFRYMYTNGIGTDTKLIADDQVLKVHKFVLQSRSPVFKSMFEHNTSEKNDRAVFIPDIQFKTLENLMWYLYTGEVQKLTYDEVCDLYEAADKYQVHTLQQACSDVLMLSIEINTVCRIMVLACLHSDCILKSHCLHYIWRNFTKVKQTEEWEMTMQSYKNIATEVLTIIKKFPCGSVPIKDEQLGLF